MSELLVFDPAMCCSTGVCGPEVDAELVRFAGDLEWLRSRGASVRRYNLAQEAGAFAGNPLVRRSLHAEGTGCLPLLLVDGAVVSKGRYPDREELAGWAGVAGEVRSAAGGAFAKGACCSPAPVPVGGGRPRGSTGCC